jgi:hypothetical protein
MDKHPVTFRVHSHSNFVGLEIEEYTTEQST